MLSWPPACGVCTIYDVVMLQPHRATPPYLGSIVNCYIANPFFLTQSALLFPPSGFPLRGGFLYPPLDTLLSTSAVHPHSIIFPPELHLSPSQHTNTHHSLLHILTPLHPCLLLCSRHACRISNAAPLPPPKCLLTNHSASFWLPFVSTTAPGGSLPPCNLYLCHKPPR